MHAASRDALAKVAQQLDETVTEVPVAAQTGTELFDAVEVLDGDRTLRVSVAKTSATPQQRADLIGAVFGGKVAQSTVDILRAAAAQPWSTPREFRAGLVALGRRAFFRGAQHEGQLEQVETELFQLSRLLEANPELTSLLTDRTTPVDRKRGLMASVLYGKVTMYTEALALQVIGRPENNAIDDLAALAGLAAELRGLKVARVTSASELTDDQREGLRAKLAGVYDHDVALHTEVDESLLGGAIVRVGYDRIDGSTRGKIERLRAALA